jgi:hypothetical protein
MSAAATVQPLMRCRTCHADNSSAAHDTYASVLVCGTADINQIIKNCETEVHPAITAWCNQCHSVKMLVGQQMPLIAQIAFHQQCQDFNNTLLH